MIDTLSPSGRLMAECADDIRLYLKTLGLPISTPDLINVLMRKARAEGKALSSRDFGESCVVDTRRESYGAALWFLRSKAEVLTQRGTWLQCWHEHVPQSDRQNWWGGNDD